MALKKLKFDVRDCSTTEKQALVGRLAALGYNQPPWSEDLYHSVGFILAPTTAMLGPSTLGWCSYSKLALTFFDGLTDYTPATLADLCLTDSLEVPDSESPRLTDLDVAYCREQLTVARETLDELTADAIMDRKTIDGTDAIGKILDEVLGLLFRPI